MYQQKLKKNVKNEFMRIKKNTKNFKKLIEISIRFDDILYNKVIKKNTIIRIKNLKFMQKKTLIKKVFILKVKNNIY